MILLDFYSGSHGHFLEYLINTYIFQGPRVEPLFNHLGSSHLKYNNKDYLIHKKVHCGHYSEFNSKVDEPESVIRITVDSEFENICYQINVFFRAGDIPANNKLMNIPKDVRNSSALLRNNFFSKLQDHGYACSPTMWRWQAKPAFIIPMSNLYDRFKIYQTLNQIAGFFQAKFSPDASFNKVWEEFMRLNQGWHHWQKATNLLNHVLCGDNHDFESDEWTQALLNYFLSQSIGLYDGVLFESDEYPTNTAEIHKLVQFELANFDNKF